MPKPALADIERLMAELVVPFYCVERDLTLPIQSRRLENDAEHSWSVAFLACSLAPEIDKSLDVGIIAQYAIVHDLVEVFAGDTSPWHTKNIRESKAKREAKALTHLTKQYTRFPWVSRTIHEYEHRTTKEAVFVWAVDKIVVLLLRYLDQGKHYKDKGVTKKRFDAELASHRAKAHAHPDVGAYYDQLLALFNKHPEYFHQEKEQLHV